jgi:hypothetical protein
MGYEHHGRIRENGHIEKDLISAGSPELAMQPEDDAFHLTDHGIGDFEWWYFDLYEEKSGCFLKIVVHIGTDPLRTRVFPQLAVSVSTADGDKSFFKPYHFSDIETDTRQCNISIKEDVRIRTEHHHPLEYFVEIDIPGFKCILKFISELEGWKPLGNEVPFLIGRKSGRFSWIIPQPKAGVEGDFTFRGQTYVMSDALGYHDHNYIQVDKKHPLHLDELVNRWYWGRCHVKGYTLVFMDTYCKTNRMLSLLVADDNNIIHSSNNLIDCLVAATEMDPSLGTEYPSSLMIQSKDPDFPMQAAFHSARLLDSRDLLEGVNPLLKWLIKTLIARPAYHGVFAKVRLNIFDQSVDGFGNYESMVFRNK